MVDQKVYKQTEVGKIPLEWRAAKIREIGEVKMCRRVFNYQTKIIGEIPFYKIGTFGKDPDAFISKELYHEYRLKFSFPQKGDILISAAGTIGRTIVYNGEDSYFQDSNIVWVENKKQIVSNEYLYYVYQIIKYNTEGGTIQRLYNSILLNAAFPLPPLPEQTAIATALSDMDELIAQTEKLIEKKKAIKQGVMQELLRPKKGWNKNKISEVYKIFKGRGLSKGKLHESGENSCILYGELFTTYKEEINEIFGRTSFNEGVISVKEDILFPGSTTTTGADLAKASTLSQSGVQLGGDIIILRKSLTELDSLFVTYFLNCFRKNQIAQLTKGITIHHLYGKDLLDIEIEFPEYMEQIKISNTLRAFVNELNTLEKKLQKLTNQKQGMMQTLLTGKIRLV